MCEFFFTAPEEQNTVRIFNVAFSRDGRGSSCPDVETSDTLSRSCGFTSNFERMI